MLEMGGDCSGSRVRCVRDRTDSAEKDTLVKQSGFGDSLKLVVDDC